MLERRSRWRSRSNDSCSSDRNELCTLTTKSSGLPFNFMALDPKSRTCFEFSAMALQVRYTASLIGSSVHTVHILRPSHAPELHQGLQCKCDDQLQTMKHVFGVMSSLFRQVRHGNIHVSKAVINNHGYKSTASKLRDSIYNAVP